MNPVFVIYMAGDESGSGQSRHARKLHCSRSRVFIQLREHAPTIATATPTANRTRIGFARIPSTCLFVGEFLILCSALDKDGYEIGETFQRAGSFVPPGVRAGALRCPTRDLVP